MENELIPGNIYVHIKTLCMIILRTAAAIRTATNTNSGGIHKKKKSRLVVYILGITADCSSGVSCITHN